jgi:hypothetical protein
MTSLSFIFLLNGLLSTGQRQTDSIVRVTTPEITVHAGATTLININVLIRKGFHIQANKINDTFIIPTTLEIASHAMIRTGEPDFPAGSKFKLEGTTDSLLVYDGSFNIAIRCSVSKGIQKKKFVLDAKLNYQACDDKTCFFPKTVAFPLIIRVI